MVKTLFKFAVVGGFVAMTSSVSHGQAKPAANGDWSTYGGDPGSTRHSPLTEITPANVEKLAPAWTYHAFVPPDPATAAAPPAAGRGGGGGGGRNAGPGMRGSQATPIVVDGIMYMPTPYNRVVALEAHTGK